MFSIYKYRKVFFAFSLVLILAGVLAAVFFGIELDIQYKGGSIITYSLDEEIDLVQAQTLIESTINQNVTVQETSQLGDQSRSLVINVAGNIALSPENMAQLEQALAAEFPEADIELQEANLVDPFIGREMLINAVWAVIIAMVLIIGFVWFRFRSISGPSAGVMALVALFHDVLIVFFIFVIMRMPLNESLIAVILPILGYSVYDTIVIYDRIRENKGLYGGKMPLVDMVDLSIKQSLNRSINTTITTFGAMLTVYIFASLYGIRAIQQFALPMMIGLLSGAYSTIFLAGPLWTMWKTRGSRSGY